MRSEKKSSIGEKENKQKSIIETWNEFNETLNYIFSLLPW